MLQLSIRKALVSTFYYCWELTVLGYRQRGWRTYKPTQINSRKITKIADALQQQLYIAPHILTLNYCIIYAYDLSVNFIIRQFKPTHTSE